MADILFIASWEWVVVSRSIFALITRIEGTLCRSCQASYLPSLNCRQAFFAWKLVNGSHAVGENVWHGYSFGRLRGNKDQDCVIFVREILKFGSSWFKKRPPGLGRSAVLTVKIRLQVWAFPVMFKMLAFYHDKGITLGFSLFHLYLNVFVNMRL